METLQSTIFIEFDVNTKKITFLRGDNIVDYDSNVTSIYVRVKYKNLSGNTVYLTPSELEDYKFSLYTIKPATNNVNVITGEVTDELKENVYGGVVKFEIPRKCTNRLGIVKCEIHIRQWDKMIASSTFVLDVRQSLVTAFDDELLGDEDFPVLKQLILEIQKDSNIDDNNRSKITSYSSDKVETIKEDLSSQIKRKANQSDLEVEKARIDSFTRLAEGSTTGDAELIDGRIGHDGVTYKNIGTAIRTQIKPINDALQGIEKDLDLYSYNEQNGYLSVNVESNSMKYIDTENYCSKTTNKIPCSYGDVFIYEGVGRNSSSSWVFFEDNLIKEVGFYEGKTEVIIPEGVNYVMFSSFCNIDSNPILNIECKSSKNSKLTEHIKIIDNNINELLNLSSMLQKEVNVYGYFEHEGYLMVDGSNKLIFSEDKSFHSITTSVIRCNEGDIFEYIGVSRNTAVGWAFLDDNNNVIDYGNNTSAIDGAKKLVTIPEGISYVIFSSFAKVENDLVLEINSLNGDNTFSSRLNKKLDSITKLANDANCCCYPNLFDKTKVVEGFINGAGAITTNEAKVNYYTSDYILFENGKTYTLSPNVRIIAYYNLDKNLIKVDSEAKLSPYTFTVEEDCYLRFSIYVNTLNTFMVEEGETNTPYKPHELTLKNEVNFNTSHKEYIESIVKSLPNLKANVLFGKKLVTCGDSFTEGDFSTFVDENGLSGKDSPVLYDSVRGCYKTYPWWIAERNNMELVNEAKCGTTITYLPEYSNAFSETRYKNIPEDADYILIKIGINDDSGHKNAPIGTIDDTTNETFYGAWNVVLEYLITNHPWAKIGIIVTNGCKESYATAIRESAKKWGIPYLDEANGENIPLLNRTVKSYVCEKAKQLRDVQMRVGASNSHPNIKAHEYESTIVENFLRSL